RVRSSASACRRTAAISAAGRSTVSFSGRGSGIGCLAEMPILDVTAQVFGVFVWPDDLARRSVIADGWIAGVLVHPHESLGLRLPLENPEVNAGLAGDQIALHLSSPVLMPIYIRHDTSACNKYIFPNVGTGDAT